MADTEDRAKIIVEMQDRASAAISGMSTSWGKFIGGISIGNVVADAAAKILGKVKDAISSMTIDAAHVAARIEVLNHVFEMTGQRAGYSGEQLETVKQKLIALGIAEQEAVGIGMRFIQAQLDIADATKVARAAQDLAVISGQNSSETALQLTDAIVKQRPILLKQYGIIADLNDIYGAQATALNKSVDSLTESERRQAFLNEILRQSQTVAGAYDTAMEDVGKRLTSLPRYMQQAQNAIGQHFLPMMGLAVDSATDFLKAIEAAFTPKTDMLVKSLNVMQETRTTFEATTKRVAELRAELDKLPPVTERSVTQHTRFRDILAELEGIFPGIVLSIGNETTALTNLSDVLDRITSKRDAEQREKDNELLGETTDEYIALIRELNFLNSTMDEGRRVLFNYEQGLDRLGVPFRNVATWQKEFIESGGRVGTQGLIDIEKDMRRVTADIENWKERMAEIPDRVEALTDGLNDMLSPLSQLYPNLKDNAEAQGKLNQTLGDAVIFYQAIHKSVEQQNDDLNEEKIWIEEMRSKWDEFYKERLANEDAQWRSENENLTRRIEAFDVERDLQIASNVAMAETRSEEEIAFAADIQQRIDAMTAGNQSILDNHHDSVVIRRNQEEQLNRAMVDIAGRGVSQMVSNMMTGRHSMRQVFEGMAQDFAAFFIEQSLLSLINVFIPGLGSILGGIFDTPANDRMVMTQGEHFTKFFSRGALDAMAVFPAQFAAAATAGAASGAYPMGGTGGGAGPGGNTFVFQGPVTDRRFISDTVVPLIEQQSIGGFSSVLVSRDNLTGKDDVIVL